MCKEKNMEFIHFIDASLKENVLNNGIFLSSNYREINDESTGIFCYPLIRIPFKTYVAEEDYDDINDYLAFKKEEKLLNESLSLEEAWGVVGASRVTRRYSNVKEVAAVIFEIESKHWPITVFINIGHRIGNVFAQILENNPNEGIFYRGYKNSLLETIKRIKFEKYLIASAPFTVNSEENLLELISKLKLADGGIWKEDSFECMLTSNVSKHCIKKIIKLDNRY